MSLQIESDLIKILEKIESKIDKLDEKLESKIDKLDEKFEKKFTKIEERLLEIEKSQVGIEEKVEDLAKRVNDQAFLIKVC
jgi:Skp family chaperone for outer membrane proteins